MIDDRSIVFSLWTRDKEKTQKAFATNIRVPKQSKNPQWNTSSTSTTTTMEKQFQQSLQSPQSPSRRVLSLALISVVLLLCLRGSDAFVRSQQGTGIIYTIAGSSKSVPCLLEGGLYVSSSGSTALFAGKKKTARDESTKSSAISRSRSRFTTGSRSRDSWSKLGRKESRFGVRSRVKSVLKKARNRTGITSNSEGSENSRAGLGGAPRGRQIKTVVTAAGVVADSASISGLGAVLVDKENGTVDVALDFVPQPSPDNDVMSTVSQSRRQQQQQQQQIASSKPEVRSASSYSHSGNAQHLTPYPEDDLVLASRTSTESNGVGERKGENSLSEAVAEALPFTLPELTAEQQRQLDIGERVQFQNDMGREGSGFVVLDVKAPPDVVWQCLLDFHSYPETIPTVRDVTMYTNTHLSGDYTLEKPVAFEDGTVATLEHGVPSVTRAAFTLSKFRLKIAAIHKYRPHPLGDYMIFTLDPACTNLVLKAAKGVWHTQSNPDGKGEDFTRVWLLCEVKVSRLLPQWITDYAARRAMPRATTWLRPQVEAANALWLNKKARKKG